MRKIVIALLVTFCSVSLQAQTFTEHLHQKTGKGSVTVEQSSEIDKLVNGKASVMNSVPRKKVETIDSKKTVERQTTNAGRKPALPESAVTTKKTEPQRQQDRTAQVQRNDSLKKAAEAQRAAEELRAAEEKRTAEEKRAAEEKRLADERRAAELHAANRERTETKEKEEVETVNMRKKVMRGSRKITGYRIQVYSGGNSRQDRQRAQDIGNKIKMKFPDQPVYVHFYSPSWKCRVGNFRTYEEANRMLRKIKAMGFNSATILRGKITVQY